MTADGMTGGIGWLLDRTAVLLLGVAVGTAIGLAFAPGLYNFAAAPVRVANPAASPPKGPATAPATAPSPTGLSATATPAPARRPAPALVRALAEGRRLRVAVLGDSFGDGLWSGLYHRLPARAGYEVLRYSQQSTGFTRYASLNLEDRLAERLAEGPIDVAVISFGANDTQGIYANGKGAALLTPAWQAEIGARITRYIARLRAQGAEVYWVGLPVMRDPRYDADIAGLNAFYAGLMARLAVPFIETRSLSVDATGHYAAYLPDPATGAPRLMRANDGVHMVMAGYERLTGPLAARIDAHVAATRRELAAASPATASPAVAVAS